MKLLKSIFVGCLLLLQGLILSAQNHPIYAGGSGDGFSEARYLQATNNGIYLGNAADGFSMTSFTQPLNNELFYGGEADGFSIASFAQPLNNDLFAGGAADGFSFSTYRQVLNNSIYAGGDADGFSTIAYAPSLNSDIYAGGSADGFGTVTYTQAFNNEIYTGGSADGFSLIAYTQPLNNSIFTGGDSDGFDFTVYRTTISEVAVKIMLQGPYDAANQNMQTNLNGLADFPRIEPYSNLGYVLQNQGVPILAGAPFFADIVDWVVVEVRDPSNSIYLARAALLLKNGAVVDAKGSPSVKFRDLPDGDYFIAVRHRNHLGVMTAGKITMIRIGQ